MRREFFVLFVGVLLVGAGCSSYSEISNTPPEQAMNEQGEERDTTEESGQDESEEKNMGESQPSDDEMVRDQQIDEDGGVETEERAKGEEAMKKAEDPDTKQEEKMIDTAKPAADSGSYETYAPEKLALAANNNVVLFFHAPWCPTCKIANENLNTTAIPDGLIILKTDYDSSAELKKKYGITYQHTFVQVDAEGNMLAKWVGSLTIDQIAAQVK